MTTRAPKTDATPQSQDDAAGKVATEDAATKKVVAPKDAAESLADEMLPAWIWLAEYDQGKHPEAEQAAMEKWQPYLDAQGHKDLDSLEQPDSRARTDINQLDFHQLLEAIDNLQRHLAQADLLGDLAFTPNSGRSLGDELESIVSAAYQTFGGQELYPSTLDKAAHLFCGVMRGHPLIDGNKRMALALLCWFLGQHNLAMRMNTQDQVGLAIFVAKTAGENHDNLVAAVKQATADHLTG